MRFESKYKGKMCLVHHSFSFISTTQAFIYSQLLALTVPDGTSRKPKCIKLTFSCFQPSRLQPAPLTVLFSYARNPIQTASARHSPISVTIRRKIAVSLASHLVVYTKCSWFQTQFPLEETTSMTRSARSTFSPKAVLANSTSKHFCSFW